MVQGVARLLGIWSNDPRAGMVALVGGVIGVTAALIAINALLGTPLPNPGVLYLPLVAMLAYHWGWRYALVGAALEMACVYFFFIEPAARLKPVTTLMVTQLAVLAFVTIFVLALVQLARARRHLAERAADRFAALNRVGNSLAGELREQPLLHLIASTARDLTGAEFAAFTLRPVDEHGEPSVPAEGNRFHLAAVTGVSAEQEALFRRMPLGGEGVLAPIFRRGVPVRVADALALGGPGFHHVDQQHVDTSLRYRGVPHGHPIARSFLGAPLLDSDGEVRGGLLLGHSQPDQFTEADQDLLMGLAAQAAVALENARLYHAARTQARELDATFESISDGVMLVDAHGNVLRENGAALRVRQALARADALATTEEVVRAAVTQALAGAHADGTPVAVTFDENETREYMVTSAPLRRLRASHDRATETHHLAAAVPSSPALEESVVVVWHDVTATHRLLEEQRARADIEARQTLLRLLIDELPSGVYLVHGPDARLVLANHAAEEVWGAVWERGQPMVDFLRSSGTHIFAPNGRALAPDDLATLHAVRSGVNVRHHQEVIRQPGGAALPVLLNAVTLDHVALHLDLPARAGEAATDAREMVALVVLQDVTPLKETERLKDEFIGVAAHELRTPLAALKGFVEMLSMQSARGKGQPLDAWQREALDAIDQATARLVDLIDDLLDVTRLQGGRLQLRLEAHDLLALVRRVVRRLTMTSERHPITVIAEAEHVVACLDPARIEQVVSNLLTNAVKYSPDGGAVELTVGADEVAGEAVLTVRDHGIGIPVEQRAMLFGRFMRADNARDRGIAGTGLGLYLCREIVERHGGRIWFDSTEGQGTTFYVALPLNMPPDAIGDVPHPEAQAGVYLDATKRVAE